MKCIHWSIVLICHRFFFEAGYRLLKTYIVSLVCVMFGLLQVNHWRFLRKIGMQKIEIETTTYFNVVFVLSDFSFSCVLNWCTLFS